MENINIKDFFKYLKGYIVIMILLLIIAVSGVVVYDTAIKKPIYQAQTTVVIANVDDSNKTTTLNDLSVSQKLASEYSVIAKSELVLKQVIENLAAPITTSELSKNVTVKTVNSTAILDITVKTGKAKLSSTVANELVKVFAEEVKKIYGTDNITQLSAAETPTAPINNTIIRDMVLAAMISIMAVVGFAFLKFYIDDTVKDNEDTERTVGMPVTGRVSKSEAKKGKKGVGELIVEKMPKAIVSENIKGLRTNLQFTAVDKALKTILITSTNAGEGKSFISANLAISFAQADKRVLLVDCDLRKGRVHKLFNIPNVRGLSNLLTDDLRSYAKYIRGTEINRLNVITCGTYPPNPSELLASRKNKQLIKILKDAYDVVIFDGAPVGGLADSVILSSFVDGTLIVVRDSATTVKDLVSVKKSLVKVGARILGIVINMSNRKTSKYYNSHYYEEPPEKKKQPAK